MTVAVKERPILFSGPMVQAILDGRKTQTRRVVKPQPVYQDIQGLFASWVFSKNAASGTGTLWPNGREKVLELCPYGQLGDRLWVRETWGHAHDENREAYIAYRATDPEARFECCKGHPYEEWPTRSQMKWKPSIHIPRCASRILLEITDTRVEQLLDITLEDAIAEGFGNEREFNELFLKLNPHLKDTNPWVWVVDFKQANTLSSLGRE